jgi:hypothetical protein
MPVIQLWMWGSGGSRLVWAKKKKKSEIPSQPTSMVVEVCACDPSYI